MKMYHIDIDAWRALIRAVQESGNNQITLKVWQVEELLRRIDELQIALNSAEAEEDSEHTNLTDEPST